VALGDRVRKRTPTQRQGEARSTLAGKGILHHEYIFQHLDTMKGCSLFTKTVAGIDSHAHRSVMHTAVQYIAQQACKCKNDRASSVSGAPRQSNSCSVILPLPQPLAYPFQYAEDLVQRNRT